MKRRATIHGVLFQTGSAACAAALLLFGVSGCFTTPKNVLRPQQAEETGRERYGVKTIGEYCEVADIGPKYVGGVGIVTGLDGTGGDSPKDENRSFLEKYLLQYAAKYHLQRSPTISEIMNSGKAALVIVSGEIPPGTRPGERFDVEVFLPRGSNATSLRGGVLESCLLTTYDYAHGPEGAVSTVKGHDIASAAGPLQLSLGISEGGDDSERLTKAHIWEGGCSKIDNTLSLVLNSDQQSSRKSAQMAECINQTFAVGIADDAKLAIPAGKDGVRLRVPPAYKLNVPHYLRVVRLIPMDDPGEQPGDTAGQPKSYRQRLAEDLLDPTHTVTAALRLEALGQKSVPVLKQGLESKHPLVRFCAAESLTYLGHGVGTTQLGELVEQQPFLRSYALSALASLDENVTRAKLQELMEKGGADETRYGAFRALQALAPTDRETGRNRDVRSRGAVRAAVRVHVQRLHGHGASRHRHAVRRRLCAAAGQTDPRAVRPERQRRAAPAGEDGRDVSRGGRNPARRRQRQEGELSGGVECSAAGSLGGGVGGVRQEQ
jgi:hypothetical protein